MPLKYSMILITSVALITLVDYEVIQRSRMHSLMLDKLLLIESLFALLAGDPLLLAVHPLVMTFQIVRIADCH